MSDSDTDTNLRGPAPPFHRKLTRYRRGRSFTGSALVTSLVACQPHTFTKRFYAVYFSHELHEKQYIVCLSEVQSFVDSNKTRYKWSKPVVKCSDRYQNPCDRPSGARISYLHLSDIIDEVLNTDDDENPQVEQEKVEEPVRKPRTASFLYGFADAGRRVTSESDLPISVQRTMSEMRGMSLPDGLDRAVFEPIKDDHVYASVDHVMGGDDRFLHYANGLSPKMPDMTNHPNGSYSDNEKHLIETMKTMQKQHDTVVKNYEGRINALMTKMTELWNIAEFLEHSGTNKSNGNSPVVSPEGSRKDKTFPAFSSLTSNPPCHTPTKPPIRPSVPMLPLEWKRLLVTDMAERKKTLWHAAKDVTVDTKDIESHFALQRPKSPFVETLRRSKGARILTETRSQAVSDVINGVTFDVSDVQDALERMDFTKVSIKSLQELVLITSHEDEIAKIEQYQHSAMTSSDRLPLADAERFLYDVTRIPKLGERVRFCIFADNFYNDLFVIDDQLSVVRKACETLTSSASVRTFLELLLSVGNHMNGGTQLGQADGFSTNVVTKIKDVKSLNGDVNLLQYLVRQLCRHSNPNSDVTRGQSNHDVTGACGACPLPECDAIRRAASVSLREVENKLREMVENLRVNEEKVKDVRQLSGFFPHARQKVDELRHRVGTTRSTVVECKNYLCWQDDNRHPSLTHHNRVFFTSWSSLFYDCKKYWTLEQRRTQRDAFKNTAKMQWMPIRPAHFIPPPPPPHATSTPMTSPIPREMTSQHDLVTSPIYEPIKSPVEESTLKRARLTPNEAIASRQNRSLGSPNSAFVTPTKRYGSLRRSAAVNAAFGSGKFQSPNQFRENSSSKNSSPNSFSPRDESPRLNGLRDSPSPKNVPQPDSPRSNFVSDVVMRSQSRSPRSRDDQRRHSATITLPSPADSFSVDPPLSISDYSPKIELHSKMVPARRRTIGGPMDKPPPYLFRRQDSETDSCATTPPPVPPHPQDYVNQEDLDQIIRPKPRSRSPLHFENESPQKLEQFVNFHRQKSDEECPPYMRQRSFSEASSTVGSELGTLDKKPRTPLKENVFDYDDTISTPQSELSAPIKPLYKASFSAGPFNRPRAQTDVSPGKNDYRSALRRVSMKNPSMFVNNQLRT